MNDNFNPNIENMSKIPYFRRCVIQNFPFIEKDFDAVTDYQLLSKVVEYLNKVIKQQNIVEDNISELIRVYEELKNYVEHYFDNLDVQDEINNKLDEMAESGQLADIIAQYLELTSLITFNTFNDLKNADNVANGSTCMILGYNVYNDGKRNFYKIRKILNTDSIDNVNIVALTNYNDLIAEKVDYYYNDFNLEMHVPYNVGACYIFKLPNNKVLIYDIGEHSEWEAIDNCLTSLNITKIDYLIISHFHHDHVQNIDYLAENYDLSNCTCWIGMKPDFDNHAADLEETEQVWDDAYDTLIDAGLTPIIPTNDSVVELDTDLSLHFLNTSLEIAENNNFYSANAEWHDTGKVNLNIFSLIVELTYKSNKITLTGDIERVVETTYTNYMKKTDILIMPHHGINRSGDFRFYKAMSPKVAFFNYPTNKHAEGWIYNYFKPYQYMQKLNAEIIASAWATEVDNMFSFYINQNTIVNNIKRGIPPVGRLINFGDLFPEPIYYVNHEKETRLTVTLSDLISNMKAVDKLSVYWYTSYNTDYPQLHSDLVALYPNFSSDSLITIEKIGVSSQAKITIEKNNMKVEYIGNGTTFTTKRGSGFIPTQTSTNDLITYLKKLPIGKYICSYFNDTNDSALGSVNYTLDIDLVENDGTNIKASIIATERETSASRTKVIATTYLNSGSYTQYTWKLITTS